MLTCELLKNHAGVALISDYKSLQNFYEVVHEVNEKSVLVKDKEGSFLGLAYDLRKAIEKQRRIYKPPADTPEIGPRFGVEILWPVILVQCRMLRASLAYFDSSKRQQACAFELEHVLEEALRSDFGPESEPIKEQWERIDPSHPYVEEHYQGRSGLYCS